MHAPSRVPVVLYVADDVDETFLLKAAVQLAGDKLVLKAVDTAERAMEYIEGKGVYSDRTVDPFPALIISESRLRMSSTYDLLKWVRNNRDLKELGFIVFTSMPGFERAAWHYENGATALLAKPSSFRRLRELVECLQRCLEATPPSFELLRSSPEYCPPPEVEPIGSRVLRALTR